MRRRHLSQASGLRRHLRQGSRLRSRRRRRPSNLKLQVRPVGYNYALVLVLAAPLIYGCGIQSPQHMAAKAIEKRLPALIGPAQSWDVNVAGSDLELARGRASEVKLHVVDVQLSKALTLDDVLIDSTDLTFDRSTHKLTHAGKTTATVSIGADNLSSYLYARHPDWSSLQISYSGQDIAAQLPLQILGQTANVKMNGRFVPDPSNAEDVDLHADSASVASIPIPISLVNYALGHLNPLVSLRGFRYPVQIESTNVTNNELVVRGSIQITQ